MTCNETYKDALAKNQHDKTVEVGLSFSSLNDLWKEGWEVQAVYNFTRVTL